MKNEVSARKFICECDCSFHTLVASIQFIIITLKCNLRKLKLQKSIEISAVLTVPVQNGVSKSHNRSLLPVPFKINPYGLIPIGVRNSIQTGINMLTLYHYDRSTAAQRVRLGLEEKKHIVKLLILLWVMQQKAEGFHKLNPKGLIPLLVHDKFALRRSTLILEYLEKHSQMMTV